MRTMSAILRFGYWKTLRMLTQTCMYTMMLSFQHFPFAQHGLIALSKVEKKMDEVQPSATLGGGVEKKKKGKKKSIKYKDGSHTDSVLGLAWNKEYRNILASASADKMVKIWDVTTKTCNLTLENHTDKVQAVAWNHFMPQVLLSGSFDHSVVMKDGRQPKHCGFRWPVMLMSKAWHGIHTQSIPLWSVWKMAWLLALTFVLLALICPLNLSHVSLSMHMTNQFVQLHIIVWFQIFLLLAQWIRW